MTERTVVHYLGGDVLATDNPRVIRTRLLPLNELGRTNRGVFAVPDNTVELPADPDVLALNIDHAQQNNVARCVELEEIPGDAVWASWLFAKTPEADAALADALDPNGQRTRVSAEFGPAVIRAGKLVSAKLWGAALVDRGAFPSAMVMAADVGELADDTPTGRPGVIEVPEGGTLALETTELPATITATVTDAEGETVETADYRPVEEPSQEENTDVTATRVPATTPNGRPKTPANPEPGKTPTVSPVHIFAALAKIHSGQDSDGEATNLIMANAGSEHVFAALNDIKYGTGVGAGINQIPAWLGEMYAGKTFVRKFAPLFGPSKSLTSMKVAGWKWGTKPTGADYAGDKANVPSNTPTVDPFADTAWRFAGGHDHDRAYVDFDNPEYWAAYWAAMVESYEKWFDSKVLTKVLGAATDVEADNPSGLTIGAGLSALIDGAAVVLDADATPSFAVMSTDLWKATMKTPTNATLGYLNASLGLEEGTLDNNGFRILGSSDIPAGHVLVGAREAASPYELGGGTPVRVDALDMVKGGVDTGLFGYGALYIHKPDAIVDVAPYTP